MTCSGKQLYTQASSRSKKARGEGRACQSYARVKDGVFCPLRHTHLPASPPVGGCAKAPARPSGPQSRRVTPCPPRCAKIGGRGGRSLAAAGPSGSQGGEHNSRFGCRDARETTCSPPQTPRGAPPLRSDVGARPQPTLSSGHGDFGAGGRAPEWHPGQGGMRRFLGRNEAPNTLCPF